MSETPIDYSCVDDDDLHDRRAKLRNLAQH
jgi:hypothetical protein